MENEPESASALAWRLTIEALASFNEVKPSLLHDVINQASEFPDDAKKNAGEMVALRCLEGLFGSLDDIREDGPSAQHSKVTFDSSESCEDVVKRIYKETPKSALRVAGPEMLKWDVRPFIAQKRASMRSTLHQLKDTILDGTHPYVDFLKPKSGLVSVNKRDGIYLNNDDHNELSRRLDSGSLDFHGQKVKGKGSSLLLEDERRLSVADPSTSSLLPSKGSRVDVDHASEDEASQLPGFDGGFMNVKKLQKSWLADENNENNGDRISLNNDDHVELSRRLDSSSSDAQGRKEKINGSPLLLEDERGPSVADPSSSSLLPSKRSRVDHGSQDEATQLPGCDDSYLNVKKLKQHSAHTLYSGQEVASSNETELLEDSIEIVVPQSEGDDTDHLDECPMTLVERKVVDEEHFGSKRSEQCTATDELHQGESGIPCHTMPDHAQDDEMHEIVPVEKVNDTSDLPSEPKAANSSPAEGNLHNTSTDDSKCDSGHDNHVNAISTMSHSGFTSETVATDIDVGMNPNDEEIDMLSDSDGHLNDTTDIAMKKNEFISSQYMVDRDSFLLADRRKLTVCVKCNEGGLLLSCNISDCPLVVHDKCLGSSARMNDGDFYCPFCLYSLAISEYLEAKETAALAKKNVATFIRIGLEHQSIFFKEVLQQKDLGPSRKAGVEDVAKICEDVNLANKDDQVTLDGEHVNEVIDHQSPKGTDIEQTMKLSKPLHIVNSNHRENEASPLRVAPDVLAGEKDSDELVDQECQGNTVAEVVDREECQGNTVEEAVDQEECQGNTVEEVVDQEECQGNTVEEVVDQEECQGNTVEEAVDEEECQGNTVEEVVDQECQGNVAELEDGLKATKQYDIYEFLSEDQGPVEAATKQEGLHYQTDDNEDEPVYAINIEGAKSSDDENDESIISRYSIRFRREYHNTCPETPQSRRKKLPWTAEEEETLREGVRKFSSSVERSPTIPWKKILEFGSTVFLKGRTSIDLKDKWRNLCRSPKFK